MIEIEFYKIPLSVDFEKLKPKLLYDPRLIKAISDYADELALKDVET
jgi:hypothetical protein